MQPAWHGHDSRVEGIVMSDGFLLDCGLREITKAPAYPLDNGVDKEYRLPSKSPERGDVVLLDNSPTANDGEARLRRLSHNDFLVRGSRVFEIKSIPRRVAR